MIERRPTPESAQFWQGLARGELLLPLCGDCGRFHFYPRALCPYCWSRRLSWRPATGNGTLHTFSVLHQRVLGIEPPVVVAVVDLDEGVRIVTNLVGAEPDSVRCDLRVRAAILSGADQLPLLCFRPANAKG